MNLQILYASEGENRKPDEASTEAITGGPDKAGIISYKGHDFVPLNYRTPTSCDACHKTVWHVLHPPPALECKRKFSHCINLLGGSPQFFKQAMQTFVHVI